MHLTFSFKINSNLIDILPTSKSNIYIYEGILLYTVFKNHLKSTFLYLYLNELLFWMLDRTSFFACISRSLSKNFPKDLDNEYVELSYVAAHKLLVLFPAPNRRF